MSTNASPHAEALRLLLEIDPSLLPVAAIAGPLPERAGLPGFEGLASVVVSQLVSRASADAIWARLTATTGPLTPESYLRVARGEGPRLGLTAAKADTLVRVADALVAGTLDLDGLSDIPADQALATLTSIKGIGSWTAEVHLLFHCGHGDIFPAGDLALRVAYGAAFGLVGKPEIPELRRAALAWAPWRSTAARLLWAYYARIGRGGAAVLPSAD